MLVNSVACHALRELLAAFDLRVVVVFGSMASGTARNDSDVDIAVLGQGELPAEQRIAITEVLALHFDRPIDLIDLQTVGEPLLGQILQTGQRVVRSTDEWATLLVRHWGNQEDFVPLQRQILKARRDAWLTS